MNMREGKGFYWKGFEVLRAGFLSSLEGQKEEKENRRRRREWGRGLEGGRPA